MSEADQVEKTLDRFSHDAVHVDRKYIQSNNYLSISERLRTHKVFTKDQCFTLIIISSP